MFCALASTPAVCWQVHKRNTCCMCRSFAITWSGNVDVIKGLDDSRGRHT